MKLSTLSLVFVLLFSTSCALFVDEYQVNSRKVIAYLLEDLPLPDDADIIKLPTVLLGTGDAISGRITLESGYSPAENLIFYGNETLTTGWQLISSKVDLNDIISSVGNSEIKPTVSVIITFLRLPFTIFFIFVSRVANSIFFDNTHSPVNLLNSVDLPAFV